MKIALLDRNNNNNNNNNINNNNNNNNDNNIGDIENNVNNDNLIMRIGNDNNLTMEELIKEDKSLMLFFMILGLYIKDDSNSIGIKIIARSWQFCLLLFGCIGCIWNAFVQGITNITTLKEILSSPNSTRVDIFIGYGQVLDNFIVPLIQVLSLMYGVYIVNKEMRHQIINIDLVSKHLASCKRVTGIFFIFMFLLTIIIDTLSMTRDSYDNFTISNNDDYLKKTGENTYPLYVFSTFTTFLFLNISVLCYLTVMMFFTSLTLKQIRDLQENLIKMIDTNTLITDHYMYLKEKIISLKSRSYLSALLLMITAAINVVCFMFDLWLGSYNYFNNIWSYEEMIVFDLSTFPFLLKVITTISIIS